MKLTKQEIAQFYNIVSTCVQAGIEEIVFQDKNICVASAMKLGYCGIIARNGVPALPKKMGIARLATLKKRLDLLITSSDLEIELKETTRDEIIEISMSAGKSKTQYRCTATAIIKAPADINDGGILGFITFTKDELSNVFNAIRAMSASSVTLIVKADGTVVFEASDSNDRFSIELNTKMERTEEDASGVFYYESSIFTSLLKAAIGTGEKLSVAVGISGTVQFELNYCEMSMFAQINGDN